MPAARRALVERRNQELLHYSLKLRDLSSSASVISKPPDYSSLASRVFVLAELGSTGPGMGAPSVVRLAVMPSVVGQGVCPTMVDSQQEL